MTKMSGTTLIKAVCAVLALSILSPAGLAPAASLDGDPALKGKIGYRCMKGRDGSDYYHIATVFDDTARIALQERAFFKYYTEATKLVSGGSVEVVPLEMIAETAVA